MKKLITGALRCLGHLLEALGIIISTPGWLLLFAADGLLGWTDKKNVNNMTDEERRDYYGYGRKW